jgi:poly(3-hydroxybutyrate) depolymerase
MRRAPPIALAAGLGLLLAAPAARALPGELRKDWPCAGCSTVLPAGASPAGPRPLLVALHGDANGDPSAAAKVLRALRPASEEAGVILLVLRCPVEKGCRSGSFWRWMISGDHDGRWVGAQIDAVAASVPVDAARVYAAGYSGGASYLGWYVPTFPERFAAVAHIAGGVPWGTPCPRCPVHVRFTLGVGDPMLVPYTRPLRDYYEACGGNEVVWETLPGVSHEGILGVVQGGKGSSLLAWLLEHRAGCAEASAGADAGSPSVSEDAGASAAVDAGAKVQEEAPTDAGASLRSAAPPTPAAQRMSPGCACDLGGAARGAGSAMAALILGALIAGRRRARRDQSL